MDCCGREMLFVEQPNPDHLHLHCPVCGNQYHQDRMYTADDWFFLVTETTHAEKDANHGVKN